MLIDHTNGRVLDVLESRDKSVLKAWLSEGKASGLLAQVEQVTTDMWEGYPNAAREELGYGVQIVIDRFHVMKRFQEHLEKQRRQIQGTLPPEATEALKGSRWLWITNPQNLSPEQQAELERLKSRFPALAALSQHREQLREIFENREIRTASVGIVHLRAWCRQGRERGLKALEPFYKTLEKWMAKIANYFPTRANNGRAEGFNRGLRALLWRAAGMSNFTHFRLRVLSVFG